MRRGGAHKLTGVLDGGLAHRPPGLLVLQRDQSSEVQGAPLLDREPRSVVGQAVVGRNDPRRPVCLSIRPSPATRPALRAQSVSCLSVAPPSPGSTVTTTRAAPPPSSASSTTRPRSAARPSTPAPSGGATPNQATRCGRVDCQGPGGKPGQLQHRLLPHTHTRVREVLGLDKLAEALRGPPGGAHRPLRAPAAPDVDWLWLRAGARPRVPSSPGRGYNRS